MKNDQHLTNFMKKDQIRGRRQSQEKEKSTLDRWISQIVRDGSNKELVLASTQTPPKKKGLHRSKKSAEKAQKMRVIPLGGLEEVGKNSMIFEYGDDIVAIDMGFQFPEEDMLGIDYVIPDITYLEERQRRIRGIIITHGHLDHIGGLAYVLPKLGFPPVYGTKLTLGLIKKQLSEHGVLKQSDLREIKSSDRLKLGHFEAKFFRVNHSIPDGVGVHLKSPVGSIVHTGDFKFDPTPADDLPAELDRIKAIGKKQGFERVDVLFSDSTNALKVGRTISEKIIGESLDRVIADASGRIIIASFSSLIGRVQQILNSAQRHGRVVALSGRSMENNVGIARELGYLKVPRELIKSIKEVTKLPANKILIITTGSQGEAMSALTRMSINEHKHVKIQKADTVIISAHPIIGNERAVATVINNLCKLGANIVNNDIMDVHTSGHGRQDDLEQMIRMIRPKNLAPIHGNFYMRTAHGKIGKKVGFKDENLFLFEGNGNIMEIDRSGVRVVKETVPSNYIVVDGLGMGDIGSQVLVDREVMAQNGVLFVLFRVDRKTRKLKDKPLVLSRGFLYTEETEKIIAEIQKDSEKAYNSLLSKDPKANVFHVCNYVKRVLDGVAHRSLGRRPLIFPWVMNV